MRDRLGYPGPGCALVVGAYELLPSPDLRPLSGPPPAFAFAAEWSSGLCVDRLGDVLANRHVVRACRRITISGHGFRAATARLVALPTIRRSTWPC